LDDYQLGTVRELVAASLSMGSRKACQLAQFSRSAYSRRAKRKTRRGSVVDQLSGDSPRIEVRFSLTGQEVATSLERLLGTGPTPVSLTVDHGTAPRLDGETKLPARARHCLGNARFVWHGEEGACARDVPQRYPGGAGEGQRGPVAGFHASAETLDPIRQRPVWPVNRRFAVPSGYRLRQ
jgi:hypothetical protein